MFVFNFTVTLSIIIASLDCALLQTQEQCIPYNRCPSIEHLLQNQNSFIARTLLISITCYNVNRTPYVRCIPQAKIDQFIGKARLLPDEHLCGLEGVGRKISSGEPAELDDYPWLALLKYSIGRHFNYGCHGNLINSRYVVTAAHCVDEKVLAAKANRLAAVVLGEYDLDTVTDCDPLDKTFCVTAKEYAVESTIIHPNYYRNISTGDIALVRMTQDVVETTFIKPICLPPLDLIITPDDRFWIAGWGENNNLKFNRVKMRAQFQLRNNDNCEGTNVVLNRNHFCTSSANTSEAKTCPGDSGGPLMLRRENNDGNWQYYLAGILSGGRRCYGASKISIYTRVSLYIRWIIETIQK